MRVYILFQGYVDYDGDYHEEFLKVSSSTEELKSQAFDEIEKSEKRYRNLKERYELDPEKYYLDKRDIERYEYSKTLYKRFYNYDEQIPDMESISGPAFPSIFIIKEFDV